MTHPSGSIRAWTLVLCFLGVAIVAASSATAPPDTPQGHRIAALLRAFEAGTPEAIRALVTENFAASAQKEVPLEKRVERLGGVAREIGPLELQQVLEATGPEVRFLARARKGGDWLEIGMMLEPGPSFGILGLKFDQSEGPGAAVEKPKGSDAAVAAAADAYLRRLARDDQFSGVALIAKNGAPVFEKAYGLANRDLGVPNRADTKFNVGSINKIFTQVAIAQLAAEGKLSLADTVRKHIPDYPSSAADRITLQQLVTMSSGLGDIFGERFDATPKDRLRTLADFLPLFVDQPLLFEPGTDRRYSNAGYIVLGLIIEKVSGEPYHDYVRRHVFLPAGMRESGAYPQDSVVPNRAVGYTQEGGDGSGSHAPRVNIYGLPACPSSAGGGYATARDLLAFDVAMRHEKLLSPDWTDWFYSEKATAPAAGPRTEPAPPPRRRSGSGGYAGGTPGANAVLEADLSTGYTIVVLSNLDPPSAESVARKLRQWLGLR